MYANNFPNEICDFLCVGVFLKCPGLNGIKLKSCTYCSFYLKQKRLLLFCSVIYNYYLFLKYVFRMTFLMGLRNILHFCFPMDSIIISIIVELIMNEALRLCLNHTPFKFPVLYSYVDDLFAILRK